MNKQAVIGGIVALALLIGGYVWWQNSPVPAGEREKVTIAEFGEVFIYAPLYVADAQGFFEKEGLDVTITPTGGDEKTFAALLVGDAQFGVADPTFVAISGEKGQPGRVIAAILRGVPFWGVASDSDIPQITQPSQLNGYKVATFPAPSTAYTLQKQMFEQGGLQPNIAETAFGSLLAALEAGSVDIALELEPNVSTAVKNGSRIVYGLPDFYSDFALTGLTALPDYLEKNPATAQKAVNALQEAMEYIQKNPEETSQILVARFPEVDPSVARSAVQNMIDSNVFPKDALVDKASWNAAIQLRQDAGDLTKPAPYDEYVVTTFAEKAR